MPKGINNHASSYTRVPRPPPQQPNVNTNTPTRHSAPASRRPPPPPPTERTQAIRTDKIIKIAQSLLSALERQRENGR